MGDTISRQAAIDALDGNIIVTSRESAQAVMDYIRGCADRMRSLPSAQPDLDSAYTEGYTAAESKYRKMWDEMPKIIRCKDCKHKPHQSDKYNYDNGDCGFEIIFPDYRCPCRCDDEYYNRIPDNDWYCGNAERRTDETAI